MTDLQHAILQTLAYHALFEFPLTREEMSRGLISDRIFLEDEVYGTIESMIPERLSRVEGFITERGYEHFVHLRKERYREAEKKFCKALRFVRVCRFLPFVRMIAISNTLGYSNARAASDIDFFIIAEARHLWTARFFITGLAALLHLRPTAFVRKNQLCLCFYHSTENLSLETLALAQDIYLPHWIAQLYPLYDTNDTYEHFWQANAWIKKILPHTQSVKPVSRRTVHPSGVSRSFQLFLEKCTMRAEPWLQRIQEAKLPPALKQQRGLGTGVVTSPYLLKFHEDDKRASLTRTWRQRIPS